MQLSLSSRFGLHVFGCRVRTWRAFVFCVCCATGECERGGRQTSFIVFCAEPSPPTYPSSTPSVGSQTGTSGSSSKQSPTALFADPFPSSRSQRRNPSSPSCHPWRRSTQPSSCEHYAAPSRSSTLATGHKMQISAYEQHAATDPFFMRASPQHVVFCGCVPPKCSSTRPPFFFGGRCW